MKTYKELLMIRDVHAVKSKIQLWLEADPEVLGVEEDPDTGDLIVVFQPSDRPRTMRVITRAEPSDADGDQMSTPRHK